MTEELDSFEDAAELALAEMEEAPSIDTEPAEPAGEEEAQDESGQAESSENEQPESQEQEAQETEEEDSEEESIFSDIEPEEVEDETPVSIDDLGDDTLIDLGPGAEPKTLRELKDSGLREADYTRKTQQLAEQRKTNEKAVKLWEALQKEPQAVVKQLAVEAGYVDEDATPVKAVDFAPLQTAEEREAEVEKLVEQRVEEHPDVVAAKRQSAIRTIEAEFDRLEEVFDTSLNQASRQDILNEAKRRGVNDLELVTQSMLAKRQKKQAKTEDLKGSAPSRSTGQTSKEANTDPADSFEEAAERALVELGYSD